MPTLPLGATLAPPSVFTLPAEAQALLDSGAVEAFLATCTLPEHSAPYWDTRIDVLVPHALPASRVLTSWDQIRASGIDGLDTALAAIAHSPRTSAFEIRRLWTHRTRPQPPSPEEAVVLVVAREAWWLISPDSPAYQAMDSHAQQGAVGVAPHAFATVLVPLPTPPLTRHAAMGCVARVLPTLPVLHRALEAVTPTLPWGAYTLGAPDVFGLVSPPSP